MGGKKIPQLSNSERKKRKNKALSKKEKQGQESDICVELDKVTLEKTDSEPDPVPTPSLDRFWAKINETSDCGKHRNPLGRLTPPSQRKVLNIGITPDGRVLHCKELKKYRH